MPKAHITRRRVRKAPAARIIDEGWALHSLAGLEILTTKVFDSVPWGVHGFSTRKGGASRLKGVAALNLGFVDWDLRKNVTGNRGAFVRAISGPRTPSQLGAKIGNEESLITLRQMHSDVVHVFSKTPAEPSQGDAMLCGQAGRHLGIQTADCVPILLADPQHRIVAAVHAGWRGTLARVAAKTIGRMRLEFGTRAEDVIAALGPAIGPCCYEVGPEVAQAFSGQFAQAAEWFEGPFERLAAGEEPNPLPWLTMMPPGHEPPPERVQLNLRAANRWQLVDAGLHPRNIAVSTLCTGCRTDLFFSYRKEGVSTGRMMSVIGIAANLRSRKKG
jgi:polyphenol oxidase